MAHSILLYHSKCENTNDRPRIKSRKPQTQCWMVCERVSQLLQELFRAEYCCPLLNADCPSVEVIARLDGVLIILLSHPSALISCGKPSPFSFSSSTFSKSRFKLSFLRICICSECAVYRFTVSMIIQTFLLSSKKIWWKGNLPSALAECLT